MSLYDYNLTLRIDDAILEKLIAGKLCLGIRKYVDSNNERDVANLTFISVDYHHIAPNNQFQWNENYQIAATSQGFSEGKVVDTTSTSIVDINYGETASLEGSDFTVASDPNAPPNGFLFNIGQTTSDVSAVLYINGIAGETNQSPAFITSINRPSTWLIPLQKVIIFFEQDIQAGTMTTTIPDSSVVIDLTDDKTQTWEYTSSGQWNNIQ